MWRLQRELCSGGELLLDLDSILRVRKLPEILELLDFLDGIYDIQIDVSGH